MRYCLTPVRMVIIEKTKNSKGWREYEENDSHTYLIYYVIRAVGERIGDNNRPVDRRENAQRRAR